MQQTLSNWQQWQIEGYEPLKKAPEVVAELVGGRTNKTFLVASEEFQAVLRVNSPHSIKLGIDRQREARILKLLQPTGVTPKVYFVSHEVLVSEFIVGRTLGKKSLKNSHTMEALSLALRSVQSVEMPDDMPRNYLQYCQRYLDQLSSQVVSDQVREHIEQAARVVDQGGWQPVICHHDMVLENIIETDNGLFIIDWEYAALGHPGLDFLRLYGSDYMVNNQQQESLQALLKVKQAMDKLWLAVQL